jgi:DNA-binding transcriptional LysR family regulator
MCNLTIQQIYIFLSIAKSKNLSRSAEKLFISQSALSRTIQRFEKNIGVHVFQRNSQGVALTPEGQYLYEIFDPLYITLNNAIDKARTLSATSDERQLRIVAPEIFDISFAFEAARKYIAEFEKNHPDVIVTEYLREFKEMRNALEYGDTDIAIIQDFFLRELSNISYKCISEFIFFLAMSTEHPLAASSEIDFKSLSNEVFYRIAIMDEKATREGYLADCLEFGFEPKRFEFVPNAQTLIHNIQKRKGMSICSQFTVFGQQSIKYFSLPPTSQKKYLVAAWRSNLLTSEARLFIDMLPGDIMQQ